MKILLNTKFAETVKKLEKENNKGFALPSSVSHPDNYLNKIPSEKEISSWGDSIKRCLLLSDGKPGIFAYDRTFIILGFSLILPYSADSKFPVFRNRVELSHIDNYSVSRLLYITDMFSPVIGRELLFSELKEDPKICRYFAEKTRTAVKKCAKAKTKSEILCIFQSFSKGDKAWH